MSWHPFRVHENLGTLDSGGIAALNHRLQAGIPSGWGGEETMHGSSEAIRKEIAAPDREIAGGTRACRLQAGISSGWGLLIGAANDAGGIRACSRWPSAATPPETKSKPDATPAGVAAFPEIARLDAATSDLPDNIKALL